MALRVRAPHPSPPLQGGRETLLGRVLVVGWDRFQPRTEALGPSLGGESVHLHGGWPGRHPILLPLRYLADAVRMWQLLRRKRPKVLVVITPPVVAPAVAWLWCLTHRCRFVVDCHTATFYWWKWRWSVPLHWFLFRAVAVVLCHTDADATRVRSWGVPAVVLSDDLPDPAQASPLPRRDDRPRVVVAGSLETDEPVAEALMAAALLPDVEVRVTGNPRRLPAAVRERAPRNVVFTGYLPHTQFLGELLTADAVAVFTTCTHAMNRAAFEAIALSRPLVLSDLPLLRDRFEEAPLYCANRPDAMARAIQRALDERHAREERSRALQRQLLDQRETAMAELQAALARP
jgi:glycosyltransferase involved in cell wall biosynthesis